MRQLDIDLPTEVPPPDFLTGGLPNRLRKGRGAVSNATGRFETQKRELADDGWRHAALEEDDPPRIPTTVGLDTTKTIIARNTSPDVPFDRSINPYRGCEHGCVYCFARPSHAYLGLSPGLDFETKLFRKPDAAALLEAELAKPGYEADTIALGANTDPYQPIEREERITRSILEVLDGCNHPVGIVTKGALVSRDVDILGGMASRSLAKVAMSVTTLDRDLARRMEPRASTPAKRLRAIETLAKAGVPVHVLVAPIIPGINDHEIEAVLRSAKDAGARGAGWVLLRLPHEIKDLMAEWLEAHFPDRAERVMSLVRQTRGGKLYQSRWRERQRGRGPIADLIDQRFRIAKTKLRMHDRSAPLDTEAFRAPVPQGGQFSLL